MISVWFIWWIFSLKHGSIIAQVLRHDPHHPLGYLPHAAYPATTTPFSIPADSPGCFYQYAGRQALCAFPFERRSQVTLQECLDVCAQSFAGVCLGVQYYTHGQRCDLFGGQVHHQARRTRQGGTGPQQPQPQPQQPQLPLGRAEFAHLIADDEYYYVDDYNEGVLSLQDDYDDYRAGAAPPAFRPADVLPATGLIDFSTIVRDRRQPSSGFSEYNRRYVDNDGNLVETSVIPGSSPDKIILRTKVTTRIRPASNRRRRQVEQRPPPMMEHADRIGRLLATGAGYDHPVVRLTPRSGRRDARLPVSYGYGQPQPEQHQGYGQPQPEQHQTSYGGARETPCDGTYAHLIESYGYDYYVPTTCPALVTLAPTVATTLVPLPDGVQCPDGQVARYLRVDEAELAGNDEFIFQTADIEACLTACTNNQLPTGETAACRSVDFNSASSSCAISTEVLVPIGNGQPELNTDSTYYEKICVTTEASEQCPGTFVRFPQMVLVGYAETVVDAPTLTDCLSQCLAAQQLFGFDCESAMYFYEETELNCVLNSESSRTQPDFFAQTFEEAVDYFEITCAVRQRLRQRRKQTAGSFGDINLPVLRESSTNVLPLTAGWGPWTTCYERSQFQARFRNCHSVNPHSCERQRQRCDTSRLVQQSRLSRLVRQRQPQSPWPLPPLSDDHSPGASTRRGGSSQPPSPKSAYINRAKMSRRNRFAAQKLERYLAAQYAQNLDSAPQHNQRRGTDSKIVGPPEDSDSVEDGPNIQSTAAEDDLERERQRRAFLAARFG